MGISARAAICSTVLSGQAPKPLSGAPKARAGFDGESADRAIIDVDEIGHCLRDRVPNFTGQVPLVIVNAAELTFLSVVHGLIAITLYGDPVAVDLASMDRRIRKQHVRRGTEN